MKQITLDEPEWRLCVTCIAECLQVRAVIEESESTELLKALLAVITERALGWETDSLLERAPSKEKP